MKYMIGNLRGYGRFRGHYVEPYGGVKLSLEAGTDCWKEAIDSRNVQSVGSLLAGAYDYYIQLCQELRTGINQWARAIFTGQAAFDPKAEELLKSELQRLLNPAKDVAALGRAWDEKCFQLERLDYLHYCVMDMDYLLKNWVSPRLSTSPAPRTKLSEAAQQEAAGRLENLASLPNDWEPGDPTQRASLRRRRTGIANG